MARMPLPRLLFVLSVLAALPLGGCIVAIGPRYVVESQKIDLSYPAGSSEVAEVHATYRLRNTGKASVENFDLNLPSPEIFKIQDVAIHWSGAEVQQQPVGDSKIEFRFPLTAKWDVGQREELDVAYKFLTVSGESSSSAGAPAEFLLLGAGWYPELRPTVGTFATIGSFPKTWDLILHLPQNFQIHAGGNEVAHSNKAGDSQFLFRQRLGGRQPFVVAGPFAHQDIKAGSFTVSFWSQAAASAARLRALAQRIASANDYFTREFGPRVENSANAWVVECPARAGAVQHIPWLARAGCVTLPGTVVVPDGFLESSRPESFLVQPGGAQSLAAQFAASWLFGMSYPTATNALFPMAGAPAYAEFSFDSTREPGRRQAMIQSLLDQVPAVPPDTGKNRPKTLAAIVRDDPSELRHAALIKSELFFIALEDRCGPNHLHRAITRMRHILRHDPWTAADLRSALEAECGADLGGFFRSWLDASDIPQDFRARYSGAAIKSPSEEKQ
jgi:hypothetical protein